MAKCIGILFGGPFLHFFRLWQFRIINVDYRSVWFAEFLFVIVGLGINFFGQAQPVGACFSQPYQFFQPGCACGFQMKTRAGFFDRLPDYAIDRELIAAWNAR